MLKLISFKGSEAEIEAEIEDGGKRKDVRRKRMFLVLTYEEPFL